MKTYLLLFVMACALMTCAFITGPSSAQSYVWSSSSPGGTEPMDASGLWWVNNDAWNGNAGPQTIYANNQSSWYVVSNQPNLGGAVETYPDSEFDVGGRNNGLPNTTIAQYTALTSNFSEAFPSAAGSWDAAYDLWMDNWDKEIMIWNEWSGSQQFWPSIATQTVTLGGVPYLYYKNGGESMFFAQTQVKSGSVNILAALQWLVSQGYLNSTDVPTQLEYGVEICSTNGSETFPLTGLSISSSSSLIGQTVTLKGANGYYVSCDLNDPNAALDCKYQTTTPGTWEQFQVVSAGSGYVALKAVNGYFVSCDLNNGTILDCKYQQTTPLNWESFTWQSLGNGNAALLAYADAFYVSCDEYTASDYLDAKYQQTNPLSWETFSCPAAGTAPGATPDFLTSDSTNASPHAMTISHYDPTAATTPATATPAFSTASPQTVKISDSTSNAVIFYTTDGSTPTLSSTRYTGPISVSSTETINAIATAPGHWDSTVATTASAR